MSNLTSGGQLITGVNAANGQWKSMVVNKDAVIAQLEVDGVDAVAAKNLAGNELISGMYLNAPAKSFITLIRLASGSVIMY